jgi:protein-tyrosine-phosphatase
MAFPSNEVAVPEARVTTAGTLVVDGQPMSWRTRAALEGVGLAIPDHRSRQAGPGDLARADLVVALAPEHVQWVRRTHPEAAARTATLHRLVRDLPADPRPLPERVVSLGLAAAQLGDWEEVVDPGGGDAEDFLACAREIVELVDRLAPVLAGCRTT